jgi:E3 ubiquitin-protein ligase RNF13
VGYLLQPLEDSTGCQLVTTPFANWIALVKRGNCSVATKVRNMQQSGAMAVAIGDLELKSSWFTMYNLGNTNNQREACFMHI